MGAVGWINSVELAQAIATADDKPKEFRVEVTARDALVMRDTVEGRLGQVDALLKPLGYTLKSCAGQGGFATVYVWQVPHDVPIKFTEYQWKDIDLRLMDMPWARGFCARVERDMQRQQEIFRTARTPMRVLEAISGGCDSDGCVKVHLDDLTWLYDQWQRLELEHGERLRDEVIKGVSEGT